MKVTKLIAWPIRVSQAIGYFPISSSCVQKEQLLFSFPTVWCTFLLILIIITGVLFIYTWEEYTAKVNEGPLDGFTLKVVLGWSYWQTLAISYIRLNILLNRNRISELWCNLNELVAPLNIPVDSKIRAIKLRWNLRLWLCTMYTICWWTMTVVEGNSFELPIWKEFLNLSLTAFGLLHIFSLHTLELFVQITNLDFDSAMTTRSVKAVEERTVPKKNDVLERSIHAMVQSFWKVEDSVLEFNKVFHNRMVMEMSHFFIMEVLLLYFLYTEFYGEANAYWKLCWVTW
jgi:hypothetical protein